jgi:hypothetical protein
MGWTRLATEVIVVHEELPHPHQETGNEIETASVSATMSATANVNGETDLNDVATTLLRVSLGVAFLVLPATMAMDSMDLVVDQEGLVDLVVWEDTVDVLATTMATKYARRAMAAARRMDLPTHLCHTKAHQCRLVQIHGINV